MGLECGYSPVPELLVSREGIGGGGLGPVVLEGVASLLWTFGFGGGGGALEALYGDDKPDIENPSVGNRSAASFAFTTCLTTTVHADGYILMVRYHQLRIVEL